MNPLSKEEEEKDGGDSEAAAAMERLLADSDDPEDERNLFLHRVLLDYLTVNGGEDDQAVRMAPSSNFWRQNSNALPHFRP